MNESVLTYVLRYQPELLPSALSSQLMALGMVSQDLTTSHGNHARVVKALFQEMLFEQEACQGGWEGLLQSRLIDLAVRMLRLVRRRGTFEQTPFQRGNDSVDRVGRYVLRLRSHFFRQETMGDAARSVGLGRRQFTALFRKVTGQSWRQYVLGLRLQHAGMLLTNTDSSVLAIAFESGFEDASHFHHCFKASYGCSPLEYREQHRVTLLVESGPASMAEGGQGQSAGFKWRGMKGWFWTADQYLEEIQVLSSLKMNFLMNCCGYIASRPGDAWCNEWWKPMAKDKREACCRIIRACREHGVTFCFSLHPQLATSRPFDPASKEHVEAFSHHFAWAQQQGVQWFSICLGGTGWGPEGPSVGAAAHAELVNRIFGQLKRNDAGAQMILCPIACSGDGSNWEHRAYLETLAAALDPEAYVFWCGDSIVTPRITQVAAESFRSAVKHRLFLWDNYPVNDANPTMHLGPLRGRDPGLCEVVHGYLSNAMCAQNQINRIPLATCADYACNPRSYDPARSIGQAISRLGKTSAQQQVLKELVEIYPGFIVTGGGTGTNPVRGDLARLLAGFDYRSAAQDFIERIEGISRRLQQLFPEQFPATKRTVLDDIGWMKEQLSRMG